MDKITKQDTELRVVTSTITDSKSRKENTKVRSSECKEGYQENRLKLKGLHIRVLIGMYSRSKLLCLIKRVKVGSNEN